MDAFIAATRFGLGPRPDELDHIGDDPARWLRRQVGPLDAMDADLPASPVTIRAFFTARSGGRLARRALREAHRELHLRECAAWMRTLVKTDAPFAERWVVFFANHFTVSATRPEILGIAGAFVREAVRPHAFGSFRDLLGATVRHPAMLAYLDNVGSIGPDSPAGRRSGRGLNENLAREVLELHTLGVDGGYTQADVEALAAVLTGWTIVREGEDAGTTRFLARRHQPGPQTFLGEPLPDDGAATLDAALDRLAHHPATARFVATKLARHFVADVPPPGTVDTLVDAWRRSDGDLAVVARALFALPEAWEPLTKLRTPFELVVATGRALSFDERGEPLVRACRSLGQPLLGAPSPEGWPDVAAAWLGPDALLARIDWLAKAADQAVRRLDDANGLPDRLAGPVLDADLRRALDRARYPGDRLTLFLASPVFQRR